MRNLLLMLLVLLIVAAILLAPGAVQFRNAIGAVPPGVRLAGGSYDSAPAGEITASLNKTFAEPVAVYYAGQRIILRPQVIGFKIDVPEMFGEAQQYNTVSRLALVFLSQVIGHPLKPSEVPLRFTLDRDALNSWLADVASRYDRPSAPPEPDLSRLTIRPGQSGWKLDIPASRDRVISALADPSTRSADLVVRESPAPIADLQALEELLKTRLDDFPGIGGLFLHDINTGEEVSINADVAYSGLSTLRIPIVEETYRKLGRLPDIATARIISETMTLGKPGDESANRLLGLIGDNDEQAGANAVNESLRTLGLRNTFMAAPFNAKLAEPPQVSTNANSRTDLNTHPDPYMQTTPRDMGLMLEMLTKCSQGGGSLLAAYGDRLTPEACQQALSAMALNDIHELITKVMPPGTRLAHRHAYSAETHADNAVIWGPGGPYVLSIYLYNPEWLDQAVSAETMQELSQAIWNYYTLVSNPNR